MENNHARSNRLFSVLTFILIFFLLSRTPHDADMWWHLRAGQVMWEQRTILLVDIFSYTRLGYPWVNAFWLSDLVLYMLYRLGGFFALSTFVSLLGALTFHLVFRRLEGYRFIGSLVIILAALTAAPIWGPRPQIISFLLVAWLDCWLSDREQGRARTLWILVPLFALWSNLHGGWIWGILLLFAHIAGVLVRWCFALPQEKNILWREAKLLSGWTFLAALAIGFNPSKFAIWKLPFEQMHVSMQIQEWLSPDFHRIDFHPFLWMIFLLLLLSPFKGTPLNWSRLFKVIGFAYLTFVAQRNIAIFAIVTAPYLSELVNKALAGLLPKITEVSMMSLNPRLTTILNSIIVAALGTAVLGNTLLISRPSRVYANYPVEAIGWLESNLPNGRLFNSYNWGGYILWSLPEIPVFIDGRADLYGEDLIQQWFDVVLGRKNALEILNQWQVDTVLLEPGWPIIYVLEQDGWQIVFRDNQAIILTR